VTVGQTFTDTMWGSYIRDNINKLLNQGHRVLTVAQFAALTGIEDGDEAYLEVDAANGVVWHLRYVNSEPTYKWRYLGGPPLSAEIATLEGTVSTVYVALTTAGPTVTLSRAGDYDVEIGATVANTSAGQSGFMSYDIGATGAVDGDSVTILTGTSGGLTSIYRRKRKAAIAAATTLTAKYRSSSAGGSATFQSRSMSVLPVRII
jgi:hypothetical protein